MRDYYLLCTITVINNNFINFLLLYIYERETFSFFSNLKKKKKMKIDTITCHVWNIRDVDKCSVDDSIFRGKFLLARSH